MNRFEKFEPGEILRPYIRYFVISESEHGGEYKVLPDTALVMGFQYQGRPSQNPENKPGASLSFAITGTEDEYRIFKSSNNTGSVLVYFNEKGVSQFFKNPTNELFSDRIALNNFVCQSRLNHIHEQLCEAHSDIQRVVIVENFIQSIYKHSDTDLLVKSALKLIYTTKGDIRMKQLAQELHTSQSPLEKRFKNVIGATPKKFASIVRFQAIANEFSTIAGNITGTIYQAGYNDQAHFIKDFRL